MNIRNFVIIAHIDHGKSTLADRFLELTGTVQMRKMREQYLDQMDLEREKGITIKMQPVRMRYETGGKEYILNLIDTPGHVDFSYEVSRSLEAVEGAILLVDATQGIQAQTVANLRMAEEAGLVVIPAVNKVDLPTADPEGTAEEIASLLGIDAGSVLCISGKTGVGVRELLGSVIERIPAPSTNEHDVLRALVFDSLFDTYQGVIAYVRIVEGTMKKNERIRFLATGVQAEAGEVGTFSPLRVAGNELRAGETGYVATGIKAPDQVRVGDTITESRIRNKESNQHVEPLPGYREPTPVVFASIFPENQDDYVALRDSLGKLKLNDAAVSFEPLASTIAFGRGFRAGFLGMLHMEIAAERLKREYGLTLVFSNPSVAFRVKLERGGGVTAFSASMLPASQDIATIEEQWVKAEIVTPPNYLGAIATLVSERSGAILETTNIAGERLLVTFEAPLRELIVDFFDSLKSATQGFGSVAYQLSDWRRGDLVRLDFLVAGEKIEAFSEVVAKHDAYRIARERLEKLKRLLPRELFQVSLQAETDGRVIARESISALKKDVTGYLYGGDRTRKMKLWKKQKRGKKRLGEAGRVRIPPEVFLQMLKRETGR